MLSNLFGDPHLPLEREASILVGRLGAMSQQELAKLDKVMTPEVLDPLLRLLPELGELIAAIEGNKPPEVASTPSDKLQAPDKAHHQWRRNRWFNAVGYEAETAAARSIDVQLHLEGYDKNSNEYYEALSNRLQKIFSELEVK
jgi:hypothetical protein